MGSRSSFEKSLSAFRDAGNISIAVFQPNYGASQEFALTTTSLVEQTLVFGNARTLARIYSVGCPAYFKMGATGLAAASNLDSYIPSDGFIDIIIDPDEAKMRAKAVTGTGLLRVEYFR